MIYLYVYFTLNTLISKVQNTTLLKLQKFKGVENDTFTILVLTAKVKLTYFFLLIPVCKVDPGLVSALPSTFM